MPRVSRHNGPLPKCKGPKLKSFQDSSAAIKFTRLLSDNDPVDTSGGGQSHVFEVSILAKPYALKVFKFHDETDAREALLGREHDLIPDDILCGHNDPFYNECRAYGRLIDKDLNGKVAVRCHGYLTLPAEKEEELKQSFDIESWDRPDKEYVKTPSRRQPFRAIVKDLITDQSPITAKMSKKILKDLRRIRKVGIYPMDVQARNYKGGLLVDFSVAMTEPHYLFLIKEPWRVEEDYKRDDLIAFQSMMKDEGIETWERAVRNEEYCKKFRSYDARNKSPKKI